MRQQKISCPRCGGSRIATKNGPEGSPEIQPHVTNRPYCQNCGQSLDKSIQTVRAFPRVNVAALAAIVLTLVRSTN